MQITNLNLIRYDPDLGSSWRLSLVLGLSVRALPATEDSMVGSFMIGGKEIFNWIQKQKQLVMWMAMKVLEVHESKVDKQQ